MRTLLTFFLSLICLICEAQTVVYIGPININGGITNPPLAGTGPFIIFADTNGCLHPTPWTTNQWLWITNSATATSGYSNAYTPVTVYGFIGVNFSGTVGSLTNGGWKNPSTTNLVNYGNAISSPGSVATSEQFGVSSSAGAANATAVGGFSSAAGGQSTAVGYAAHATSPSDSAFGTGATASGQNSTALGVSASASATNAVALGVGATAGYSNSVAIGTGATATGPTQIMLGAPGISAVVNNWLSVLGGLTVANGVTNLLHTGTNNFPAGSDVAFARYSVASLANGNNAAVPIGTNVFVDLSGPSGAFTICGINGSPNRDGKQVELHNNTGFTMTIANQSGTDPTAGNRILTGFSADHSYTNNPGVVGLRYNGNLSRWVVIYQNGNQ